MNWKKNKINNCWLLIVDCYSKLVRTINEEHFKLNKLFATIAFRDLAINNLPILLVLFPLYFVENTRRSPAMPAFFALSKEKITSQNFGRLFFTNSLTFFFTFLLNAQVDRIDRPDDFPTPPKTEKSLFFIQRNKNVNTIAYDANLNSDGEFNHSKPIDAYWLRYTSTGYRRELSWLERNFAYGYSSKNRKGKLEVELVAYDDRKVYLEKDAEGKPIALVNVNGKKCRLDYLYVFADESGSWPKVIHMDIHATDLETGKKVKERILNN